MPVTSIEAKMYLDASGVGNGTYSEVAICENVSINNARTELPVKLRGQDNTKYAVGMRDGAVDFTLLYEPADTNFVALQTAFLNRTDVGLAFLDEDISTAADGDGWEGDYKVADFSQPQEVDTVWMVTCRAVPSIESGATAPRPYDDGVA